MDYTYNYPKTFIDIEIKKANIKVSEKTKEVSTATINPCTIP